MNKKLAAFLFALGMGLSVTATATDCMAHCQAARNWCNNAAGTDAAARAACTDTFIECAGDCDYNQY